MRLWDVETGKALRSFVGHGNWVHALTFAPDGRTLASSSSDGTVKLWQVTTSEELLSLRGDVGHYGCLAFARDGSVLALGGERGGTGVVRLWHALTEAKFDEALAHMGPVQLVITRVEPDGEADRLGLQAGDIIASYDGKDVVEWARRTGEGEAPDAPAREMKILRGNKELTVFVHSGLGAELSILRKPPQADDKPK